MRSDSASTNFKIAVCLAGFAGSSVGKESICNAGDPGLIPGLGRSTGEGVGYLLQHSWASLVVQLVNNPPAVWKTWVQSLGGRVGGLERYLGEGDGYPLQYSGLENSMDCIAHWVEKSHKRLSSFHFHFHISATSFTVWLNPD